MQKVFCLAAAAALAGCATQYSEAPLAKNFPTISQQKAQSAAHWQLIAKDASAQIGTVIDKRPVHVPSPAGQEAKSDFNQAFHKQLVAALVNSGHQVMTKPGKGVLNLAVESQLVKFSPGRYQNRHFISATAVTAGIWGVHGLNLYPQTNAVVGSLAVAGLVDWDQWFNSQYAKGETPQHELIVSISLTDDSRIVGAQTSVYYIGDLDRSLYASPKLYPVAVRGGE